ncbi:MAG: type II secretion system F family protein [Cyanobacteriota bacterium]|nr:type II secretion system F family protein [Cyanobacteriota bacterium]
MAEFEATYVNGRGQTRQITLSAADGAAARRSLRRRGIVASSVVARQGAKKTASRPETTASRWDLNRLLEPAVGIRDKALFASKLAALVDAGIPIVRSIDLMAGQQRNPRFRRALQGLSGEVNQGGSLATAMRRWPKVFDKLTVAMVEAGEIGGVLDETLKRLARLLEDNARLQNQIKGALGYPVSVLVIAILVFLGMTIFLIPTFAGIFEDLGAELPLFTQLMVDLSGLLRSSFSLILAGSLVLGSWALMRYYATAAGRRAIDALILQVPLFGDLIQKTATAQFCRTFSSLTRAGVPILLTLDIVHETSGNAVISDAILSSRQEVMEGIPLSRALGHKGVFPEMAISMLAIGEETGGMDAMLAKVADFYEDEVAAAVKVLTSMLEPAMIVIVGGIVGSILVAMYLPMFSVFEQIK